MKVLLISLLLFGGCWAQDVEGDSRPQASEGSEEEEGSVLVRCRRPMCRIFCPFGNKLGEDGCPICSCKPDPCETMECPEGQQCEVPPCAGLECVGAKGQCVPKKHECPMMKCVPCPSGHYFKDQFGCQTCDCMPVPPGVSSEGKGSAVACAMPMCSDPCPHGHVEDSNGCMTCDCKPAPKTLPPGLANPPVCPAVMCAMYCDKGFQKDERGCDICKCHQEPDECSAVRCGYFMECKMVKPSFCPRGAAPCLPSATCVVPSLCELKQKMDGGEARAMMDFMNTMFDVDKALGCREDGSFEPKQCNAEGSKCWCVDDRGVTVPGSEWSVVGGETSDRTCATKTSSVMQLSFELLHDMEDNDVKKMISDIKQWIREFLSSQMGTKQKLIVRVEVDIVARGVMAVRVDIVRDGSVDLPSAAHNVFRSCNQGYCHATFKDHKVQTKPGSMHVKHQYTEEPVSPKPITCFGYKFHLSKKAMILLPIAGVMLLLLIFITAYMIYTKKRSRSYQFSHKKLETMDSFKKNLVLSTELEKPDLLYKDEVSVTLTDDFKKVPLA